MRMDFFLFHHPSSIIHPHPGWSLESKDLTLRLKVCIVKNTHGSLHLLGTHQCTSPRCSPSHPPPILRDFDSSARDMLTLGSAPQQGPTCPWEGSPSAITTHTYQHSLSQHHRLRNLQDQFHHALVTTRSPWLPSIPHHLVSPPQRALYTLLWPSYDPSQSPSLGSCGSYCPFSAKFWIFIFFPGSSLHQNPVLSWKLCYLCCLLKGGSSLSQNPCVPGPEMEETSYLPCSGLYLSHFPKKSSSTFRSSRH